MTIDDKKIKLSLAIIAACLACNLIGNATTSVMPLIISAYIDHFSLRESIAGLLTTSESVISVIITFVVAQKLAQWRTIKTALIGALIAVVGLCGTALVMNLGLLVGFRILVAIGTGLCLAIGSALAASTNNPDRVYGIMWATSAVGDSTLFIVAPYATEAFGYAGLFWMMAIFVVINAPFLFLLVQLGTSASEDATSLFIKPSENKAGFYCLFGIFIYFVGAGSFWAFSEQIALDLVGIDPVVAGEIFAAAIISGFIASLLAALIGSKIRRSIPIFFSVILTLIACIWSIQTRDQTIFSVLFLLYLFAVYFFAPYSLAIAASLDNTGALAAKSAGLIVLGTALGPLFSGVLIDFFGYIALCWFMVLTSVLTLLAMSKTGEKQQIAES
ncbi:MAG: putative MFS family arabinose efflux permease, partial [Planctomycetota bacterium]